MCFRLSIANRNCRIAKDELSLQLPRAGNIVCRVNIGANGGLIMLKAATQALSSKGGPDNVLMHARRVLLPFGILLRNRGEAGSQFVESFLVIEEEARAIACLKALDFWTKEVDGLRSDFLGDLVAVLPELVVLLAKQNDAACAADIEGRGSILEGMVDDFKDTLVRDRGFLRDIIDGTAAGDSSKKGNGGGHGVGSIE